MELRSRESISEEHPQQLGKILLLSSGETSASGRQILDGLLSDLAPPVRIALLETPAGFELNSALVARRVAEFIKKSLRNYAPDVSVLPARRRDGPFSTNDPDLLSAMLEANFIYLGAGSPTYLVGHLENTLAFRYLVGRHRQGATLCFTSAAAIAMGAKTLPVYEIFKAGHDLHWIDGLDLFRLFGFNLAIVTHWNNREGGAQLDTSRCFMGHLRMEQLLNLLPSDTVLLGIDERTGLIFDFPLVSCEVVGEGRVSVLRSGGAHRYAHGTRFPMERLGPYKPTADIIAYGLPVRSKSEQQETHIQVPWEVLELIQRREAARRAGNWAEADEIREQVKAIGFRIEDTPEGPRYFSINSG